MTAVEDETDVQAAKVVAAEQKAELAEFDENIPWDERESENKKEREEMSKVEQELAMLQKEVKWFDRALMLVRYVSNISNCSSYVPSFQQHLNTYAINLQTADL